MDMGLTLLSGPCVFENNSAKNTVAFVKKGQADFGSLVCFYFVSRYFALTAKTVQYMSRIRSQC